jgi:phospholipase/carboxylesterase
MRDTTYGGLRVRLTGGSDREGGGDGPLVVLFHGFGAPGDDLVSLARVMNVPSDVRFAFPAAPLDLGPEANGGRAWWWIDMMKIQIAAMRGETIDRSQTVPEGLTEARTAVLAMLGELDRALSPSKLLLGGFSQGAMLACDVAMRADLPLAGLALFSGTLIAEPEWLLTAPSRHGLRVVQSHGQSDPVLPFGGAERLRDFLTGAGLDVKWIPFRGGHEIPPSALDAFATVVREGKVGKVLAGAGI